MPVSAEPTTPKGRRTRDHLVNAGRVVFARDGYVSARMSDVAQEAEISMGGLYRYFANKEDLFGQVIADLHEELFQASTATDHDFKTDPYEALVESNKGYLRHYSEQRDVMRAFIQAAHVEDRFRDFWWKMRNRHIDRFVTALKNVHGITEVNGVDAALAAESVACMVEQSAYVWYAQHKLHGSEVDLDDAARTVAHTWFVTFFGPDDHRVASS
ncbi:MULTISPECIES: TetR/AcrR family transcriptional regulator [unclassified Nocardioides]|uniref:TetR/AcrR family transcriptional regulator n=1 Tax=unclassified Nocardioides TaxID=2615069 RepID=UPI000A76B535|nr:MULTISPECIES: TetR/AcrR family transcriptional regulator [unclassified Nocardioides]